MLAIVIPFYKNVFFKECLESLANQSNKNFNLYIGNDASPDDPSDLILEYDRQLKPVYKVFEENLGGTGLTRQWERCLQMIGEEEWIMILGDDDVMGARVVEEFYANSENFNGKAKVVRFATISINEGSHHISKIFNHPKWEIPGASAFRRISGHTRSSLSEHIFRKEVYKKHGFYYFPLAWHSDDRAWLEFTEGAPIFTINEAIVYIRNSSLSISGKTDNEKEKYRASMEYYSYVLRKEMHQFTKPQKLEIARKYVTLIQRSRALTTAEWLRISKIYALNPDKAGYLHMLRLIYSRLRALRKFGK